MTLWAFLYTALKEKRVLKRCPWGTMLKNGAFFSQKDSVLLQLSPRPLQSGVCEFNAPDPYCDNNTLKIFGLLSLDANFGPVSGWKPTFCEHCI